MSWKDTEVLCSATIIGCWAFGMLAIVVAYGWNIADAILSIPALTITAVCVVILGTKLILDHAADGEPVFEDEIVPEDEPTKI